MKRKIIVFDANPLTSRQQTGVGKYTFRLVESLAEENKDTEFIGYYYDFLWRKKDLHLPKGKNISYKKITLVPGAFINLLRRLGVEVPIELLTQTKADIALFPNYLTHPSLFGARIVPVIHDLTHVFYPQYMSAKNQKDLKKYVPVSLKRASFVLCVSETTRNDVVKEYGYSGEVIITPIPYEGKETIILPVETLQADYGIHKPYVLFVGTLEPRKNIPNLIDAFVVNKELRDKYSLVICGGTDWKYESTLKKINVAKKHGVEIIATGYVSDEIRNSFFTYCSAFVSAAIYEGFGMPPLEAFHFNRPVAISNIPIFREVAENCAVYFDPQKPEDIARAILKATDIKKVTKPTYSLLTWHDIAKNISSKF